MPVMLTSLSCSLLFLGTVGASPSPVRALSPLVSAIAPAQDFEELDLWGPFDKSIPHPEKVLGYTIGTRITTYRDQERVFDEFEQAAKNKIKRIDYGKSTLGLPLRVFAISSPKNISNLEAIRKANEEVALGKKADTSSLPTIVWINECIHGNEPASFESAMMFAYNLIAGSKAAKSLDDVVVILNPAYNPDGHERFAVYYNSVARGSAQSYSYEFAEPGAVAGRFNHYRFDMNRDRVSLTQAETRQEVKLFQGWRPHIYADQHGQVENYFFPPNPMAINANVDRDRLNKWTDVLGRDAAKEFDKLGWSYFVRTDFDLYYPGYLDSFTSLCGSIGMTHETDGGKWLHKLRSDGSDVSLREGASKHLVTALALVTSGAEHRRELVASWANYKKQNRTGEIAGKFQRVALSGSWKELKRFKDHLSLAGIESKWLSEKVKTSMTGFWSGKAEEVELPAGTLVVDMNQENGALAKSLLEPGSDFEPEFVKNQLGKKSTAPEGESYPGPDSTEFYDLTAWSLPFTYGLKAWHSDSRPDWKFGEPVQNLRAKVLGKAPIYILRYTDEDDILAIHDLLAQDVRVSVTTKDFEAGKGSYSRGTFLIFASRNEDDLVKKLEAVQASRKVAFETLGTSYPDGGGRFGPGNYNTVALQKPKIGVVFGSAPSLASAGYAWYAFEKRFNLPFVAINSAQISRALADFNILVVPSGSGVAGNSKVKEWVRDGGTLISIGDSSVIGSGALFTLDEGKEETRSLPGSLFRATLEPRSLLTAGYPNGAEIAVPVEGTSFYTPKKSGGTVVKIVAEAERTYLSGWSWGDESLKAVKNTVFMHDEPGGQGHVVWFAYDPMDRGLWPGLGKLFLNSLILSSAR